MIESNTKIYIEPIIHSGVTDALSDCDTRAYTCIRCDKCDVQIHASNNELMQAWVETGKGNYCIPCFAKLLEVHDEEEFGLLRENLMSESKIGTMVAKISVSADQRGIYEAIIDTLASHLREFVDKEKLTKIIEEATRNASKYIKHETEIKFQPAPPYTDN